MVHLHILAGTVAALALGVGSYQAGQIRAEIQMRESMVIYALRWHDDQSYGGMFPGLCAYPKDGLTAWCVTDKSTLDSLPKVKKAAIYIETQTTSECRDEGCGDGWSGAKRMSH